MKLMSEKVVGYVLLAVGILIIAITAINIISVFTGNVEPVQLFNFEGIGINTKELVGDAMPVANQELDLISPDMLNDTSNLFAHIFLMGFISTVGFKIASLGTMLVRPIVVKVKEANAPEKPQQS